MPIWEHALALILVPIKVLDKIKDIRIIILPTNLVKLLSLICFSLSISVNTQNFKHFLT